MYQACLHLPSTRSPPITSLVGRQAGRQAGRQIHVWPYLGELEIVQW
jgi:hypothetical protein